ncbi:metallophosphoesterase [Salirhabdus sp. Marseille-P4669]|uniref:metallophosphoesterase n=1 Tax=Salirhabdus sp. Marseille-P4669 TaxID=2042310 RepID=UPI000C7AF000|nr:metallophosphoesterase [Salirhabdus sp. Marseille-P4669]
MIWTALLLPIGYGLYRAYRNTKDIAIHHININNTSYNQQSFQLNVLQISDMHLENISISPNELYDKLKTEPIDLIALTGDFLDRKRTIPKLVPYLKVFQRLTPTHGTYAVFGNHDYVLKGKNFDKLKETLTEHGCKTLQNETDVLTINGQKVNIIGVDDYSTNRSVFEKSYAEVEDGYQLVLTHDPNAVLAMNNYAFDYLLSGHFHGGQIRYPKAYHLAKMGKLPKMNMIKGLQTYQGKSFYISEGLGQTGINIRVGSRPEITFHHITIPENIKIKEQGA